MKMWLVLMVAGHISAVDPAPPYAKTEAACQSIAHLMSIDMAAAMGDTSDDPQVFVACIVSDSKPVIDVEDMPAPDDPPVEPDEEEND